jgi:cell wall-associated protease
VLKIPAKVNSFFIAFILLFSAAMFKVDFAFASSEIELPFDTQVSGDITDSDNEQIYKVTLNQAGRITINFESYIEEVYLDLYDANGEKVWYTQDIYTGSPSNPKKWTDWEDLEPGTYYIKISKYGDNTGKYNLKVGYTAANNNEKEPNNGTEEAQLLTLNNQTVNGFISWNDDSDFYKIVLSKAGRITVNLESYIEDVYLDLYDANGEKVWYTQDIYTGSPSNPKKWTDWEDLEPGTYYIKISKYNDRTGKYNLKVNYTAAGNNEKEPNNGTEEAQLLTLNNQTVSGFISWNDDSDFYKIVLSKAGRITVNLESYIEDVYLDLYDANGEKVWYTQDIYTGSPSNPKKWTDWEDLEPGTYYIKISKYNDRTGKYNLKVNYTAAGNNEKEPNNGTEEAQQLTLNNQTVSGFISWNDDSDFYKIVLPKAGRIIINLESYIDEVYLDLYDANGEKVWYTESIYTGSLSNPKKWSGWGDLKAGTYYIKISKHYDDTGKYKLNVQCPSLLPAPPTVNEVSNKSTAVIGKTIAYGTVSVRINSKVYTGKSDSKGSFSIKIPTQKAGTKLYITVKDKYGYTSKERVVVVVDRIPPAAPIVNNVTSKSKVITGKAEAYSTVIAYVGSQKIGSAKADKYGRYTIKITPKKAGTSIKVIAVDGAGNKSAGKVVKVKK